MSTLDTAVLRDLRAGRRRDRSPFTDAATPRLSWRTETTAANWHQTSATVAITWHDRGNARHVVTLAGAESVGVPWPFDALRSRERVTLEVSAAGTDGITAAAASIGVEAPLLDAGDWTAQWISLPAALDDQPGQLRTSFELTAAPVRARLYVSALGSYEIEINGSVVGDEVLAPGWTSYDDRVLFQTHDVTDHLRAGSNVVGAWLAGAWFSEKYGFFGRAQRRYQGAPSLLAQLEVVYADGRREVIGTGADWVGSVAGPLRSSGIYAGEEFDASLGDPSWSLPGASAKGWASARIIERGLHTLAPAPSEPVRRTQDVAAVSTFRSPAGATVVDFGQNLVGRVRIRVRGPREHTVTLRHAEVLQDGELATRQLRYAYSVDRYTLDGDGEETWEPRSTFHGFRYLQVENWPGDFDVSCVTAVVCHSDMSRTGHFVSSSDLLNRLHENVVWSMRGNFLSIPTDCPQRDERLGWTGDLQVFAGAAATLYDCDAFLASWLTDLASEQTRYGGITPIIVPVAMEPDADGALAAWGDAATVVPWTLYERFGDRDLLSRQYPSMRSWVEVELARADPDGLWTRGYQLGDWLDPKAPAGRPRDGRTHPSLVASAYRFRSAQILSHAADILGHTDDVVRYAAAAERTRESFVATYVTPRGRMVSEGPTTYAMALVFGLVTEPDLRHALGRRLAEIVREDGYRIGTGFIGTPLVMDALCATGQYAAAGRLLLQTESPSWLYPVTVGATTVWERWDALLPDGSVNPHEMTSFNHYALGAVVDWLHRGLAGLDAAAPGYRRIRIAPTVLPGLTSVSSDINTPYGPAAVAWNLTGGELSVTATVPPNTDADVLLPDGTATSVGSGSHHWVVAWSLSEPKRELHGLDTDLATLVDDPPALQAVRDTLATRDAGRARMFDGDLRYEAGSTLRTALMFADPTVLADIADTLANLAAARA